MNNLYLIFLKKLLIFTVILALAGYFITFLLPENYITPTLPYLYVFFFAITLVVHYILLKVAAKKTPGFINFFMLVTFGKLIFFLTIMLVYALLNRTDAIPFIIAFFILYVCFTVFEVILSLSHTKLKKPEGEIEKEGN
jgi:hypothetical protein